ncbi:hypothetical protein [Hymenobacter sp. UYCo722]|uniref:hypothetical protein n=1 Tax=Hymenobacter sp. UYCo722 TaxID=3156335 RepID=UPI00339AF764
MPILKTGREVQLAGVYSRETYAHPDWNSLEINGPNQSISKEILDSCRNIFGRTTAYYCNISNDFDLVQNRLPPYFSSFWLLSSGITDGDSSELAVTIFHNKYRILLTYDNLLTELNELDWDSLARETFW